MRGGLRNDDQLQECGAKQPRWVVLNPRPLDGLIKCFDREGKREEYKSFSEISQGIGNGELILIREGAPRFSAAAQGDPALDEALRIAMTHLGAVEEIRTRCRVSVAGAYTMAKKAHESKPNSVGKFASRATIYRHFDRKRNGLPLLRGNKNKGNRTPRYNEDLLQLIRDAANGRFLKPHSRWELGDITDFVNDTAHERGCLQPTSTVSREFVRKVILTDLSVDPEIDRMDPKLVAAAKSIARNRLVAATPFARVEQDALHLPFVVKTPHGPARNIWLVHAIDCCEGMPVGWHLIIGAPNESDGLKCVESILYSKAEAFERLGLQCDLDVSGTPHELVVDNGPEARNERMQKLVRLGIDVKYCKSHHAHGKPFIERMNRSLKEALQTLPGCTRHNGKDGQRDPVELGDELMTLEELEQWIVRWYFESWANTELKRHLRSDFHDTVKLGSTPARRYQRMKELGYAMPLSPPVSEWQMALYEHYERTLSRKTGISYENHNYRGDNLAYLIGKYGESKVQIVVNPDDYREIYVNDGEGMPLVALREQFVDETTPAYSFAYIAQCLKEERNERKEHPSVTKFRKDVHQRAAEAESTDGPSTKKASKTAQNRKVAAADEETKARKHAAENPLGGGQGVKQAASFAGVPFSFGNLSSAPSFEFRTGVGEEVQR